MSVTSTGHRRAGGALTKRMRRWSRKHRLAILLATLFLFIFFFPSLFMGRVVSPNDILRHYEPWGTLIGGDSQNATLNDIPTSYFGLMTLLKGEWAAFHWNPYVASGIPGFGSLGAAVLTPFVLIPTLLLPLFLVYSGVIFLKFVTSFVFSYLWLREERLGKRAAAIGSIAVSAAGVVAIWWLWPASNAIALYPLLMYLVARSFRRPLQSIPVLTAVGVCFLLSGFPATMAYGMYAALLYFLFRVIRFRNVPIGWMVRTVAAAALALLIVMPSLQAFVSLLIRTGYLESRTHASVEIFYPAHHLASFIDPYRLGDPVSRDWFGDRTLGGLNNFVEATTYLGLLPLLLSLIGVLDKRARNRWFWMVFAVVLLLMMFGVKPISNLSEKIPGLQYTPLTRLRFLLPLCAGYLSAAGFDFLRRELIQRSPVRNWKIGRRRMLMVVLSSLIGAVISAELALFAARFYPYLKVADTRLPVGPTETFLKQQRRPFRIAPYFTYFFPNTAEMLRLEDIRSHFSSESTYRRIMQRLDPGSWGEFGTVIQFNGLRFDLEDPFLSMLNVRYLLEQPSIDIVRWSIYDNTKPVGPDRGAFKILPGQRVERQIDVTDDEMYAIDLAFGLEEAANDSANVLVSLIRPETGKVLYRRQLSVAELRLPKTYVPIRPYARAGNVVLLRLESRGIRAGLLKTDAYEGESPLYYAKVHFPVILLRELPDGRLFENLGNLERFRAVWRLQRASLDTFFDSKDFDLENHAVVVEPESELTSKLAAVAPLRRRVVLQVLRYMPSEQVVRSKGDVPFLLVSSEKVTPELRVFVDDKLVAPMTVNALFAAVPLQPGEHVIRFSRRIGRGWWIPSFLALVAVVAIGVIDRKRGMHADKKVSRRRLSS